MHHAPRDARVGAVFCLEKLTEAGERAVIRKQPDNPVGERFVDIRVRFKAGFLLRQKLVMQKQGKVIGKNRKADADILLHQTVGFRGKLALDGFQGRGGCQSLADRQSRTKGSGDARVVIACTVPGQCIRRDRTVSAQKCFAVFDAKNIVRRFQRLDVRRKRRIVGDQCGAPGDRIGGAILHALPECLPEYGAFLQKAVSELHQKLDIATFAPEADAVDDAETVEQGDRAGCKVFCAAERIVHGQLQHQIRAAVQGGLRTRVLIHQGRRAALDEITAHHNDTVIGSGQFLCPGDMIGMTVVKGIVFCNDSDCFHAWLTFFFSAIIAYSPGKLNDRVTKANRRKPSGNRQEKI